MMRAHTAGLATSRPAQGGPRPSPRAAHLVGRTFNALSLVSRRLPGASSSFAPRSLLQLVRWRPDSKEALEGKAGVPEVAVQVSTQPFSWTARWWPAIPLDCLDPKIPEHVDLLGMSLVVWADSKGAWHCLEDRCPHRLAPLSEGRVEGDTLMCSYHGWCFSSGGACTRIPQLDHDPKAQASACSSRRSAAKAYPTRAENGLLWVWPEAGEAAAQAASITLVAHTPDVKSRNTWFKRELPIRYDTLFENLIDPSHVPYAHHGIAGDRKTGAAEWKDMVLSAVSKEGFHVAYNNENKLPRLITVEAPFLIKYGTAAFVGLQLLVVPTRPGWSNVITSSIDFSNKLPFSAMKRVVPSFVTALEHILARNPTFDGDTFQLHVAERLLPVKDGLGLETVTRSCYMPAAEDKPAIGFRTWLGKHGGADIPTCSAADDARMPPLMPKEQVLDRWEQHTKNCSHCKAALAGIDRALLASQIVGAAAAVAAVSQVVAAGILANVQAAGTWWQAFSAAGLQAPVAACVAVVLLCLAVHRALAGLRAKFFYEEYIHATRD